MRKKKKGSHQDMYLCISKVTAKFQDCAMCSVWDIFVEKVSFFFFFCLWAAILEAYISIFYAKSKKKYLHLMSILMV